MLAQPLTHDSGMSSTAQPPSTWNPRWTRSPNANGTVNYSLYPVGNRLSDTSTITGLNPISGTYNPNDQLSGETYDQNGNTTFTGGKSFTYDSENHLIKMVNGSTVVTLTYDAFGNRVIKSVNGVTTQYLVEDDVNPTGYPQVLEEVIGGVAARTYTYGLQRISENQIVNNAWTPSFYGYDGGGSVRQLTNSAGAVTDTYEYDAYGNKINSTGTTPNNYLYRGEQYDSDLGLYYLRARYYNPTTGRFLSRDPNAGKPTDPASLHKYLYASGDPVNALDPTGRDTIESLLTTTDISSPLEVGAKVVARALTEAFCFIAKYLARATLGIPTGMSGIPGPFPGWPGPAAALCTAFGF
jgi:RHS repeat-associated protein